ncbi:MAG TPA: hypothetical protein VF743_11930 [Acidimicrobiales bacterium]
MPSKYLLVDPLGDDPLVITGSANFDEPARAKQRRLLAGTG